MYKHISVCVNHVEERSKIILKALKYAESMQSKLVGFYIKSDMTEVRKWQMNVPLTYANKLLIDIDDYERENHSLFEKLAKPFNVEIEWLNVSKSENLFDEVLCTDLIIAEQPNKSVKSFASEESFLNNLIIETKRPVLMIPEDFDEHFLRENILIGWNSSAESMRAVIDAMPILKMAEKVFILEIHTNKEIEDHSKYIYQIQRYLDYISIDNHLILDRTSRGDNLSKLFLQRAKKEHANLIVVGGYGHSRLRELIMGGMTNYLIQHSTIPVLFSH